MEPKTPDRDVPGGRAEELAVLFTRALRRAGLAPPVGSVVGFVAALGEVGIEKRSAVYWAGRATLIHRPEDVPIFDQVFRVFFLGNAVLADQARPVEELLLAFDEPEDPDDPQDGGDDGDDGADILQVRYSASEVLRNKDFALCSVAELEEARQLMSHIRLSGARRRSRRWRRAKAKQSRLDLRRTVRHALRTDGETIRRAHLRHGDRPRRLVLLIDISGSMEAYARALLRFLHTAVVGRTKVDAFAIGTRLTRLTRELSTRDPDLALSRASQAVVDWSGGTRLGDTIAEFNDAWGVRGMARGAIVVVLSDGWDRGEPEVLAEQMQRLQRVAYKVIWVNPLKASPGYAPLAQGMAAALPYVDDFIEGHSLASLEQLAAVIEA